MSQPILIQFVSKEQVAGMRLRRCWWPGRGSGGGYKLQGAHIARTRGPYDTSTPQAGRCFEISDQRPENIEADMGGLQSLLLAILGRCTHGNQLEGTSLLSKV